MNPVFHTGTFENKISIKYILNEYNVCEFFLGGFFFTVLIMAVAQQRNTDLSVFLICDLVFREV